VRARVPAIEHTAGTPEGPSRRGGGVTYTGGIGFDEVELVGRIVVDSAAEEGEED